MTRILIAVALAALLSGCGRNEQRKEAIKDLAARCAEPLSVEMRMGGFRGDQLIVKCGAMAPGWIKEGPTS